VRGLIGVGDKTTEAYVDRSNALQGDTLFSYLLFVFSIIFFPFCEMEGDSFRLPLPIRGGDGLRSFLLTDGTYEGD
jgi:hypothetical protein